MGTRDAAAGAAAAAAVGTEAGTGAPRVGRWRGVGTGAGAMTVLGASVGVSRALTTAPLYTVQAVRYAVAGLVMVALARRAGVVVRRPRGVEWGWLVGIALVGLVMFNIALVRGLAHAEPAVIAVAIACVPVLLGVIGPVLERRAPRRRVLVAAAVVTLGSALVEGTGHADAAGLGWAAVVLGCEACFTLLAVPVLPRHGAWGVSVHSIWIGAVVFAVLAVGSEGGGAVARVTATQWIAIVYLAVMMTVVAFILWYSTVAALGAGSAGIFTGLAPVAAALTGIVLTGHVPAGTVWAGILVVFGGLGIGLGRERRRGRGCG